jgi:hypothetical protein
MSLVGQRRCFAMKELAYWGVCGLRSLSYDKRCLIASPELVAALLTFSARPLRPSLAESRDHEHAGGGDISNARAGLSYFFIDFGGRGASLAPIFLMDALAGGAAGQPNATQMGDW